MGNPSPSLVRGSATMLVSMSTAGAVSLLISIAIARMLGVKDFGIYSILVSVQGVITSFAVFGIGTAVAKFVAEARVRDMEQALRFAKAGLFLVVIFGTVTSVAYVALSGLIGDGLYHEHALVSLIPYSALVVITSAILAALMGIVQGCQNFKLLAKIQVLTPVLNLLMIALLLSTVGMKGIFLGYSLSQTIIAAIIILALNRGEFIFYPVTLEFGRTKVVPRIMGFALPAFLAGIIVVPVYWIGSTRLTLDAGFDAMGYFATAYVIFQSLTLIPNALVIPMIPKVSELTVRDHGSIERLVSRTVRIFSIVLFPPIFGLALFAHFVVDILYGPSYSSSTDTLFFMMFASYFYALSAFVGALIAGTGRMWLGLAINVCWGVVFLLIAIVFVPSLGARGLAFAFLGSYGIYLVASFVVSEKALRVNLKSAYVSAISSASFFVIGYLLLLWVGPSELAARIGLYGLSVAYFFLIGRDAFAFVIKKSVELLRHSST